MKVLSIDFDFAVTQDINQPHTERAVLDKEVYPMLLYILRMHPKTKVYVADNHANIVALVRDLLHLKGITLFNVDCHHDIVYKKSRCITCGNWASRLIVSGEVKEYIWVPRGNSEPYKGTLPYKIATLKDVAEQQFDIIFICKSSPWIPPELDGSFERLVEVAQLYHTVTLTEEEDLKNRQPGS